MPSLRQLIYYITSFWGCQVLLRKVFHLIFSEIVLSSKKIKLFSFSTRFPSSMRFLSFRCRSLTTLFIIAYFPRLVNSKFILNFDNILYKLHIFSHLYKNSTDKPCCKSLLCTCNKSTIIRCIKIKPT